MHIFNQDISRSSISGRWTNFSPVEKIVVSTIILLLLIFPFLFLGVFKGKSIRTSDRTAVSTPTPGKPDLIGKGLKFLNDDAYFISSSSGNFSDDQMTVEAIVCIPSDDPGQYNLITLQGEDRDIFTSSYTMQANGTVDSSFAMLLADDTYLSATTPVTTDNCHHLAVTAAARNGVCELQVFTDGKRSISTAKTDICRLSTRPYKQFVIGSNVHGFKSFNGIIDEVRISDIVRYNDSFIPSDIPFTPDDNTQHLFHFEGNTDDSAGGGTGANPSGETGGTEFTDGIPVPSDTVGSPTPTTSSSLSDLRGVPSGTSQPTQTVGTPTPTPIGYIAPTATPIPPGYTAPSPTPTPWTSTQTPPTDSESYTLPGSPPAAFNQAAKFTYRNQSVISIDDERMGITGSFTVEAWIKPIAEPPGIYIPAVILSKASPQTLYRTPFSLQLGLYLDNVAPYFSVDANNARYTIHATNRFLNFNQWHHVAASVNASTGSIKVFVDGFKSGELNVGHALVITDPKIATTIGALCLDENNAGYCSRHSLYFNGEIEEARISKIVRYSDNFTPPLSPVTADYDTLAIYRFDGNGLDSSGRNNHGTVKGTIEFPASTVGINQEAVPSEEVFPTGTDEFYEE